MAGSRSRRPDARHRAADGLALAAAARARAASHERVRWLTRAYFVSYAVGQVLPTSVGGDASRIFETTRRHPGQVSPITGSVLLERALGGAVTLAARGVGFLLAIGRYPIGAYLWIEALFVVATIVAGVVFFSRSVAAPARVRACRSRAGCGSRRRRARSTRASTATATTRGTLARRLRPSRSLLQLLADRSRSGRRARAVGIDLSLRPYIVLGPLLFLVMLVPFTINGLGVREAFFVSFLGKLGVDADAAFATGFLFFLMTILLALPGLAVILWESVCAARAAGARCQCLTSPSSSSRGTRCRGSSSASSPCAATRRSSSTTARPTARVELVRERFPDVRVIEQENRGMGGGNNAGMRAARRPLLLPAQLRRVGRRRRARAARRVRRRASRRRRRRAAAASTPTGRCSARCAASRRSGGSRPSTSSSASSRRARGG